MDTGEPFRRTWQKLGTQRDKHELGKCIKDIKVPIPASGSAICSRYKNSDVDVHTEALHRCQGLAATCQVPWSLHLQRQSLLLHKKPVHRLYANQVISLLVITLQKVLRFGMTTAKVPMQRRWGDCWMPTLRLTTCYASPAEWDLFEVWPKKRT